MYRPCRPLACGRSLPCGRSASRHAARLRSRTGCAPTAWLRRLRSCEHVDRIADAHDAVAARDEVLAEGDAVGRAAIGRERAQRFARGVAFAAVEVDGREHAARARLRDLELD